MFDTVIEGLNGVKFVDRSWGRSDNPKTAVVEFSKMGSNFVVE